MDRATAARGVPVSIGSPVSHLRSGCQVWVGGPDRGSLDGCDLLDHIIAINERHLKRLLSDYVHYYHEDRTHLGLGKETPGGRLRSVSNGHVIGRARLGGLHHRYDRAA